jgi:hypothetical protein
MLPTKQEIANWLEQRVSDANRRSGERWYALSLIKKTWLFYSDIHTLSLSLSIYIYVSSK